MPLPNSPAKLQPELETLRARYQKGLLAWLKAPESGAGLAIMTDALQGAVGNSPHPNPLWSASLALLNAVQSGKLPARVEYRRLAGRVDQALRRAAQGELAADPALLQELQDPLAQLDPQPQAPIEALVPRGPLANTLAATAAILPLMAQDKEPRFQREQRLAWDAAAKSLALAWEQRQHNWSPLRSSIFRLLQGALPLHHPAPLKLAEALASATDQLELKAPTPKLLAALTASVELIGEADFLEHEALDERVEQLVSRLNRSEAGPRSHTLDQLFAKEAAEEIEHMRHAMEAMPPDTDAIAAAARHLQRLADPLDLSTLALTAFRFAELTANLAPEVLDHAPGRDDALELLELLEHWVQAVGDGEPPAPPPQIPTLLERLGSYL